LAWADEPSFAPLSVCAVKQSHPDGAKFKPGGEFPAGLCDDGRAPPSYRAFAEAAAAQRAKG